MNFTGDFEAGETVVWTFSGGLADEVTITPPGGLQPVVNRVATFTFPTTGTFTIALTGGNAATGTCNETTPEKQAAVKNAVKTLTEMQLIQSLAFQGQLLTELTNLFLSGAVPVMTLERLELQLAALERKRAILNNEAARLRGVINGAPGRITKLTKDIEALAYITSWDYKIYRSEWGIRKRKKGRPITFADYMNDHLTPILEEIKKQKHDAKYIKSRIQILPILIFDAEVAVNRVIDQERAAYNNIIRSTNPHDTDWLVKKRRRMLEHWKREYRDGFGYGFPGKVTEAEAHRAAMHNEYETGPDRLKAAEEAIVRLEEQAAFYQSQQDSRNAKRAGFEAQIKGIKQQVTASQARLAEIPGELDPINSQIAQIRSEMAALRSRVGQTPAPFAGANLQGASGFTRVPGSNPYTQNPLGLKGSRGGMSFFTDLNTLKRQAHHEARLQQATGATGPQVLTETGSANILNPSYNIWAKGDFSDFESDQAGADREGQAYSFATGAYYAPSTRFMIGAMYRYRDSESESTAQNSDVETAGHGIGLNSTLVLTPKLSASAQVLYERSRNEIARGTSAITPVATTGSFDADQYVASGTLQGSLWRGTFWLRPSVGITYAYVDSEAYTDSAGTRIPGQTTEQGQVTFGPSIGFRKWRETGAIKFIEPSFTATGVWTFDDEGDTTLASGAIIEQDDVAAQFSAGLSLLFRNNAQLNLSAGYAGFGASEVESWSLGGQISIPLGGRSRPGP